MLMFFCLHQWESFAIVAEMTESPFEWMFLWLKSHIVIAYLLLVQFASASQAAEFEFSISVSVVNLAPLQAS